MRSRDITGVTGVPELTWCYNRNMGGKSFPLCWYERRIDIPAYMHVGIKGKDDEK